MIEVQNNNLTLPTLVIGQRFPFSVNVINTGDKKVHFSELKPGCGSCTDASLESYEIEAGQMTLMNLLFTPNSKGQYSKIVKMTYGDSPTSVANTYVFTFNAVVK